ncbi:MULTISPECIES: peptidylprolyl isomerase [Arsenophonus]|nr:peptidylprolyl isomerase [Candidatus Arsenophonus lipoptenae]
MIEQLRRITNSYLFKTLIIIIIFTFIFQNISGYLINNSNNQAAIVNGTVISQLQLQQAFQKEKIALKELMDTYSDDSNNYNDNIKILKNKTLERLIIKTLLNQYSSKLGLTASDNQIKKDIYNMEIFHTNGKFDNEKYRAILYKYNIKANNFAKEIKQNLMNQQIYNIYINDEFVLPEEVKFYTKLVVQKRQIKTATLLIDNYKSKQIIKNKELQDYYNKHQNDFLSPKQVKVSYIKLDIDSQRNNIVILDEEIKKYYEEHITNFIQPSQKHYSMIQLATKKEANSILQLLISGADFKKLANEKSTDKFSALNNGAIGWMDEATTPNEIINAKLTKKGQFSEVIKYNTHYIIFRLDEIRDEVIRPLKNIKNEIFNIIKNEKAINKFYSLQKTINNIVMNTNTSLTEIENITGIKSIKTNWFSKYTMPEEIKFKKISNIIFEDNLLEINNTKNIPPHIININNNCMIAIQVQNYKPQVIQKFDDVRKSIINLITLNKAKSEMENDGNKLINLLKKGKGEDDLKKLSVYFSDSKIINRFENNSLVKLIFKMEIPKNNIPTYISVKDNKNNLVIVQLVKIIEEQLTEEELKNFSQRYKAILGNVMMESLILQLRNRAKIKLGTFNEYIT